MSRKIKEIKESIQDIVVTAKVENKPVSVVMQGADLSQAPFVLKSIASNLYENAYPPNISIRDGFDRHDYDEYRPEERIPKDQKGKIIACMRAYKESGNGIVKNIVDLIADLVVQGLDVVHKNKKKEKFAKTWFNKIVFGPHVSERFVSLLCRAGNDVIKRDTGKITLSKVRKIYKGENSGEVPVNPEMPEIVKREIPIRYTFLDPRIIQIAQPELSMFLDNRDIQFVLDIPPNVMKAVQYPITEQDRALVNAVPTEISNLIQKGSHLLPLDKKKIRFHSYKKDDWEVWADPMIYPVLSDLGALKKMKMSDLSALDGVLCQIRVWKLGSVKDKIKAGLPAMQRLARILEQGIAGGILDVIWSDDIQCEEVSSNLHQFLGEAKYLPILNAIYTGLGVPPLFAGAKTEGSFTSNFLAIKAFIVRLEYLRDKLREFWNVELEILQKAMEWDEPPIITFDRMTLNDESSILQIMLHMVDRGIMSDEAMLEMVGAVPEIENFRTSREFKERKSHKRQPKVSPVVNYQHNWIDKFIQSGEVTPSEVGIELEPRAKGETPPAEASAKRDAKYAPNDLGGRPIASKDKSKRKAKTVKPQRGVSSYLIQNAIWASEAQEKINNCLTPIYLQMLDKKNLRQLSNEEFENFEKLKLGLLVNIDYGTKINEEIITATLKDNKIEVPEHINEMLELMKSEYKKENGIDPNTEVLRRLHCVTYAADNLENRMAEEGERQSDDQE